MSFRRILSTCAAVGAFCVPAALSGAATANAAAPKPVPSLDVQRYLGNWYQIASIPQWFELLCVNNTIANYRLNTDGTVRVTNRCGTPWGGGLTARGNAKVLDRETGAQLSVTFNRFGRTWLYPPVPNYIVVGLGENYDWAVVTDSYRVSGYVLAREPKLTPEQRELVLASLRGAGVDPCRLETEPQRGGARSAGRYC